MKKHLPLVRIKKATPEHVAYVIPRSEAKDWKNAERILNQQISRGFAWTGYAYMGPERGWVIGCIWGIQPRSIVGDEAWLWLVITDLIAENPFLFVRHSRRALEYTFKYYPRITACVKCDNPKAQRWLEWLGFNLSKEVDSMGLRQAVVSKETYDDGTRSGWWDRERDRSRRRRVQSG